jgi:hypothetical protein
MKWTDLLLRALNSLQYQDGHEVFSEVTGGRPLSFSRLISGGSRSPWFIRGMRRGQDSRSVDLTAFGGSRYRGPMKPKCYFIGIECLPRVPRWTGSLQDVQLGCNAFSFLLHWGLCFSIQLGPFVYYAISICCRTNTYNGIRKNPTKKSDKPW